MDALLSMLAIIGIVASVLKKAKKVSKSRPRVNVQRRSMPETEAFEVPLAETKAVSKSDSFEMRKEAVKSTPAQKGCVLRVDRKDLRRAVIMNEILGKPVSLRNR